MPVTGSRRITIGIAVAVVLVVLTCVWLFYAKKNGSDGGIAPARLVLPERTSLDVEIEAAGRLSARSTVSVGTEISGQVSRVFVDYNDTVEAGQVVAEIDPARYRAQLRSADASLAAARAELARAIEADRKVSQDLRRANELASRQLIARSDLDRAVDDAGQAASRIAVAEAEVARVLAGQESARYDLSQTTIRSPVSGVILERTIEPGQTVAASFETPVLFRVAEDLSEMTIELAVDEADVGAVEAGQEVSFSVDAFPARRFHGHVVQKRVAPKIEGNNATYPVIVAVENVEKLLVPGMLADARIRVSHRSSVMTVPTEAVRGSNEGGVPSAVEMRRAFLDAISMLELEVELRDRLSRAAESVEFDQPAQNAEPDPELVKFFGAVAASKVVIIDDASGDPIVATRRQRELQMAQSVTSVREALSEGASDTLDTIIKDIANADRAEVYILVGETSQARSVLVGISDGARTQIVHGVGDGERVILPMLDDQ